MLDERGLEVVVDDDDPVDLFVRVQLGGAPGNRLSVGILRTLAEPLPGLNQLVAAEGQARAAAAAGDEPADLDAIASELAFERKRTPQDLRVEGAREASVGRDRQQGDALHVLPTLEQRQPHRPGRPRGDPHQLEHPVGVGPHRLDAGLRAPQPSRGDELERLGDLLRIADGTDPPLQVLDGGHLAPGERLLLHREGIRELLDLFAKLLRRFV